MKFATKIDGPVAVIGDVHGQAERLERIVSRLRRRKDYQQRWIVLIGDLVDRGPDTNRVLECVLEVANEHPKTVVLCGNHELAMACSLGLIDAPPESGWLNRWLDHYGSESTFASYEVPFTDIHALRKAMPDPHLQLLSHLPWSVEHPDFFFVHSGLERNTPFDLQRRLLNDPDYTDRRPNWLCSKRLPFEDPPDDCSKTVVSGHAHVSRLVFARRRILLDTSGGLHGTLSCVLLPECQVLFSDAAVANEPLWQPDVPVSRMKVSELSGQ